ncbi:MAG: hypothetical protein C0504_13330 [Candidatus Solibacter sp.]|nr:hypothetical protein [Candidatus Solibacter sp.]
MFWPAAWNPSAAAGLLDGSPVNCLLAEPGAETAARAAASAKAIEFLPVRWTAWSETDWSRPAPFAIGDGVWPGAAASQNRQEGGPTGAPWVDANGWIAQLAGALAPPSSQIWINSKPPDELRAIEPNQYLLGLAEAWAYGARRPVWLAPHHAADALAGEGQGAAAWKSIRNLLVWLEARAAWRQYRPVSSLMVLSDFAGANEYMAGEVLNLSARQHIAVTPVHTRRAVPASFAGMKAALYVDPQPPAAALAAVLKTFVASGGLLIALKSSASAIGTPAKLDDAHPRFETYSLGKGRVAVSKQDFEDPWILARDAHLLMSRRWDSIRLFNAGSMLALHTAAPGGRSRVVHLFNYTCRASANLVSLQIPPGVSDARLHSPAAPAHSSPAIHRRDGRNEIDIPPYAVYCALELTHS